MTGRTRTALAQDATFSAWLVVPDQRRRARYAIELAGTTESTSSIAPGDSVLVSDGSGLVFHAARILRTRSRIDGTTLYFDRVHEFSPGLKLGDIGLSLPSDGSLARLTQKDVQTALSWDGVASPEDIPLIQDHAYLRDLLQLAVVDDLLGPAGGPSEDVVDMSVRDRYLVGKLAPRRPVSLDTTTLEPASGADEADDGSAPEKPPAGPGTVRHEPGAEFSGASGRVDPEEDALDEIDTTNNQSLVPSSMGLTFCVAPGVGTLEVEARWGRYERVPNDDHDHTRTRKNKRTGKEEQVKVKVWRRVPCGGVVTLSLREGRIAPLVPDPDEPDVRVQGSVHTNAQGERLVTLFLVNAQLEPVSNKDAAWLFQPEIGVRGPQGGSAPAVFRRRPVGEVVVDDEERDRLEVLYRRRVEFAVGHGVAVHAETAPDDPTRAVQVSTKVMPDYDVPVTETPGLDPNDRPAMRRMVERGWLDMKALAEMEPGDLREALGTLVDDYKAWLDEQDARVGSEVVGFDEPAREALRRCRSTLGRLREGLHVLLDDDLALRAFRFANRAMALQRVHGIYALEQRRGESVTLADVDLPKNHSWRPFQLAFLLLSIPSLADPTHIDRIDPAKAIADLLWFPTGGGKTEAYLGVAAFAMAIRRIQGPLGGLDGSRGLTVIMRYTLRLLTLQQFQRAATLLCTMETIRWDDEATWGAEPFSLGLWVGNRVTPGTTEQAHESVAALRNKDRNKTGLASPAQLTSCPWCGTEIDPGRDIEVDKVVGRTTLFCGDKYGRCAFSKNGSSGRPHPGLPVKVVDEEIYHRPPSMMIATVDKFAMMAWKAEVRTLFGRASEACERHGSLWPGHDCGGGHRARRPHPAAKVVPIGALRPPDLIIQDEFHLISGPLGTMVGLYETAVDELCTWRLDEHEVHPKIVASSATVRRADDQVRNVFMRRLAIFPPKALDVEDDFFSVQRGIEDEPGRRYLGICAPGTSRPSVLIRTYTAFLTAAQALFDVFGPVADPYMTLVGYFNSLRELGGMRRLAEDDVQTRAYRVGMSLVGRPGLAQRSVKGVVELTSRVSSSEIPKYLDQLEVPFAGTFDAREGKWVLPKAVYDTKQHKWVGPNGEEVSWPIDVVLATNMLSVGVDVNRLGVMVVNGQPKGTAEYIQATSRVGRAFPGLVASVLTWARPRDLSHYETFEHYHATFYQHVEAQSVTPFSPRAMDRGLTGTMLSFVRNRFESLAANTSAGRMTSPSLAEMTESRRVVSRRTWDVTENPSRKALAEAELKSRADDWAKEAAVPGRTLVYRKWRASGGTSIALLRPPGIDPWSMWTVPMSMREVEPGIRLVMEDDRTTMDPAWQHRPVEEGEGES